MSIETLERLLYAQNEFSFEKFAFRYGQMQALQNLEDSIIDARK
jgi:hypothetical protein